MFSSEREKHVVNNYYWLITWQMHLDVDRAPEMHISSDLLHVNAKQRTMALKAVTKINRKLNFDTVDLIKRETSFLKTQGKVNVRQNLLH